MRRPDIATWHLRATDRFGRSATLTREADDSFTLRIEPGSQQDEGEIIHHLNQRIIAELAEIVRDAQ
jgi:hypothetical protein